MALFTAFFDDSGTHASAKAVVVCGFVSPMTQWDRFDSEWNGVLAKPRFDLDYLHMKEMKSGQGKFAKFKNDLHLQRDLYDRLQRVTKVRAHQTFGCAVVLDDYRAVNAEYKLREVVGSPYTFACSVTVQKLRQWMKRWHGRDELMVVIDQGTKGWGEMSEHQHKSFGVRPVPGDSKKLSPLQAADHAAWENHRALTGGLTAGFGPEGVKLRGSYKALIKRFNGDTWFLADNDNLREAAEVKLSRR